MVTYDEKYFDKLYSSKMTISRRLLRCERFAAKAAFKFLDPNQSSDLIELQSGIEWLLTWKLKTECAPYFMWCDGVEITNVEIKPKRIVSINGKAWIGPENEDKLVKVPLEGSMEIKSTGKKFKSYGFTVHYEQFKINPSKNLTRR